MSASIIIRTYHKDVAWLQVCLESIDKYCSGFREVIALLPKGDLALADWSCIERNEIGGMPFYAHAIDEQVSDGYIAQQVTKIYADTWTSAENILFVDSDIVFFRHATPENFMRHGKPFIMFTHYDKFPVDKDMPWKAITEKFMSHTVDYEFMRRLPSMYPTALLREIREFCQLTHNIGLLAYLKLVKDREFSEFNAIGAYVYYHAPQHVHFIPTDSVSITDAGRVWKPNEIPEPCAMQFWSWGNQDEQMAQAKRLIHGDAVEA